MEAGPNEGAERRERVNITLQTMLQKIQREKPHLKNLGSGSPEGNDDVFMLYLNGKIEDIKRVKHDIGLYRNEGHHFTKQYRTLEGHCSKLQTDLDRIDVFGREDLKKLRKETLLDVNTLIKSLTKKAHSSGIVCKDCEVQK